MNLGKNQDSNLDCEALREQTQRGFESVPRTFWFLRGYIQDEPWRNQHFPVQVNKKLKCVLLMIFLS